MLKIPLPAAAILAAVLIGPVSARADPPHTRAAAPASERVFRDWRLACADTCGVRTEVLGASGTPLIVLRATPERFTLSTPLPLDLPDGVRLVLGPDAASLALAWRTCAPAGCEAEAPLDPDLLQALRRERAAEVTFTLEDGVTVRLTASLLGFTAAWQALDDLSP